MKVQGCDCTIVIKTDYREFDVPYSEETIREDVTLLIEEASIEGDGLHRAIQKRGGATGCVVTPLTIGTVDHLLYLAMGSAGTMEFVTGTRNIYKYCIEMLPMEDTGGFDLIQDRNGERIVYEACRVKDFELRINREEALKLKLDVCGNRPPTIYPYTDYFQRESGELFNGDNVKYKINGKEYPNIYGLTIGVKKENGTKTEVWIKRILENENDLPDYINEIEITAQLVRDKFENKYNGIFRITIKKLVLQSDETNINSSDTVIGPLRYYVLDTILAEVFTSGDGGIP